MSAVTINGSMSGGNSTLAAGVGGEQASMLSGDPRAARQGSRPPITPAVSERGGTERLTRSQAEELISRVRKEAGPLNTRIAFRLDDKSREVVVEVMDRRTGRVLKQIPPEELLKIRSAFRDLGRGLLLHAEA